uniref:Uncharacterized protein n=1 Tax=Myoviridae sp. ctiX384 TaxID=2827702 RepID=A0A8S5TBC6_9CAUD|nr:MAG TPA: hypothetical protein [Myoviridae sp. ctiX384]
MAERVIFVTTLLLVNYNIYAIQLIINTFVAYT